jgi:hypothetical protein
VGSIPDAVYVAEEVLEAARSWTPSKRRELAEQLRAARRAEEPSTAAQDAIRGRPGAGALPDRLASMDVATAIAAISLILHVLQFLGVGPGGDTTINETINVSKPTINVPPVVIKGTLQRVAAAPDFPGGGVFWGGEVQALGPCL